MIFQSSYFFPILSIHVNISETCCDYNYESDPHLFTNHNPVCSFRNADLNYYTYTKGDNLLVYSVGDA